MRIPTLRTAAALLVATASTAYAAGAPAAPPEQTMLPLGVDMECFYDGGGVYTCQAYAFGGTEAGYTFTWSNSNGNVSVAYDDGGYNEANAACYGGLGQGHTATVTATVTDSSGASASRSRIINCTG